MSRILDYISFDMMILEIAYNGITYEIGILISYRY